MDKRCEHEGCNLTHEALCHGHLAAFILETVAQYLDVASVGLYRDVEPDREGD